MEPNSPSVMWSLCAASEPPPPFIWTFCRGSSNDDFHTHPCITQPLGSLHWLYVQQTTVPAYLLYVPHVCDQLLWINRYSSTHSFFLCGGPHKHPLKSIVYRTFTKTSLFPKSEKIQHYYKINIYFRRTCNVWYKILITFFISCFTFHWSKLSVETNLFYIKHFFTNSSEAIPLEKKSWKH